MEANGLEIPQDKPKRTFGSFKCLHCGKPFEAKHNRQTKFCLPEHKNAFQDAQRVQGRQFAMLAKAWRLARNTKDPTKKAIGTYAFQQLASLADYYNAEDAKAEIPNALVTLRPAWAESYYFATDGKEALNQRVNTPISS